MNFRDAIRKGNGYAHKKAGHLVYEANFIFDYRNFGVDLHNCLFMTSKILESVLSPEVVIKKYGDKGWMPGKGGKHGVQQINAMLIDAQRELAAAQSYFECAESGQVDEAIFRVRAAEERINNIFRMAKSEVTENE